MNKDKLIKWIAENEYVEGEQVTAVVGTYDLLNYIDSPLAEDEPKVSDSKPFMTQASCERTIRAARAEIKRLKERRAEVIKQNIKLRKLIQVYELGYKRVLPPLSTELLTELFHLRKIAIKHDRLLKNLKGCVIADSGYIEKLEDFKQVNRGKSEGFHYIRFDQIK